MTIFVIPMAGNSQRFTDAGFTEPKYMLSVGQRSLFSYALSSFSTYFGSDTFVFIYRGGQTTREFITREVGALGIKDVHFVELTIPTSGQAETVSLGLQAFKELNEPVVIFNIDTMRSGFLMPERITPGFIEVFRGEGDGWSFVKQNSDGAVVEVREKERISDLCCNGLYGFDSPERFLTAFLNPPPANSAAEAKERYVAPLYNTLLSSGHEVVVREVESSALEFFGTPAEYELFKKQKI
tara:strand:+ start:87717 stop:88436 length:720 start_codon:yes stop_codon:yes gene_type:complete